MSEQAGYSPSFKRPSEIIRLRRKRARSDVGAAAAAAGSADSPGHGAPSAGCAPPVPAGQRSSGGGTKCRNPFASVENVSSPKRKRRACDDEAEDGSKWRLWTAMAEDKASRQRDSPEELLLSARLTEAATQHDVSGQGPGLAAPPSAAPPACGEYPADWSLKTRLLFTSPSALSWAEKPKAQEEALGLHQHCRAQSSALPPSVPDPASCSELRCAFQQSLVYWQHPSLPWLSLFPRINAEKSFAGRSAPWAQDAALQQSLMREWSVSLSSLYGLLKSTLCPYFYLCSYQFTVLFRAAGVGGSGSITALIAPTTRGLREALKTEGIEFSLPLLEKRKRSREQPAEKREEEDAEEVLSAELTEDVDSQKSDSEDEEGCFSWLKEMGVQDKIHKTDGIMLQLQRESQTVSLDHKPESVAFVEGPHTFTLINFLINFKYIVAAAGSQAGLPPTLLAPVAFRGATLHMLKSRSVNVKSQVGSTYQNVSSLEIAGPVLPSSLHAITTLLQRAQKGNFSAALYTHTPTAVMNVCAGKRQSTDGSADLSACGLQAACTEQLRKPPSLEKAALTHIKMSDYSYTWRS